MDIQDYIHAYMPTLGGYGHALISYTVICVDMLAALPYCEIHSSCQTQDYVFQS